MAKNNYATKADVRDVKTDVRSVKSDIKRLEKNIKNQILNSEVKVLGELQKMREDDSIHNFSPMRINDELQGHEKRIKSLETAKI